MVYLLKMVIFHGKLTVGPWKSPIFNGNYCSLPSPMTARVELLIYRRVPGTRCVFLGDFSSEKPWFHQQRCLLKPQTCRIYRRTRGFNCWNHKKMKVSSFGFKKVSKAKHRVLGGTIFFWPSEKIGDFYTIMSRMGWNRRVNSMVEVEHAGSWKQAQHLTYVVTFEFPLGLSKKNRPQMKVTITIWNSPQRHIRP